MIVHSARNELGPTCTVRVEGIDPNESDARVRYFAAGAAARHNCGYEVTPLDVRWIDEHGLPILGGDTSTATVALVTCRVVAP